MSITRALTIVFIVITSVYAEKEFLQSENVRQRWINSLNIENNETRETVSDHVLSNFGLKAYKENYLLLGVRQGDYTSYTPSDEYTNKEAEIQISLSYDVASNLFGLDEVYSLAYTHRAFWQIFTKSAPFRETNYNPEVFVTVPVYTYTWIGLKAIKFAPFAHMSNGQGNIEDAIQDLNVTLPPIDATYLTNRSRSWNYAYTTLYFQHNAIFTELTAWYRYPESGSDDNPGLIDYIGHGSLSVYLPYRRHLFKAMGRYNIASGNGAVEGTWSYPLSHSQSSYLYFKAFSGYGESLIDYNNYVTKFSLGLSFSR